MSLCIRPRLLISVVILTSQLSCGKGNPSGPALGSVSPGNAADFAVERTPVEIGEPGIRDTFLNTNAAANTFSYKFKVPGAFMLNSGYQSELTVAAGDLTGDGLNDVVIHLEDNGSKTRVLPGQVNGWPETTPVDGQFEVFSEISHMPFRFGNFVGDVNGDGRDDFVINAQGIDIEKHDPFIVLDLRESMASGTVPIADGIQSIRIVNSHPHKESSRTIERVDGLGDINGDGFDDMAIVYKASSDYRADVPDTYVMFGQSERFAGTVDLHTTTLSILSIDQDSEDSTRATNTQPYLQHKSPYDDINGDGYADSFKLNGNNSFLIELGGNQSHADDPQEIMVSWRQPTSLAMLSSEFNLHQSIHPAGDVDGDGINDLAIYQYSGTSEFDDWNKGQILIVYGDSNWLADTNSIAEYTVDSITVLTEAHGAPIALGDIDGDSIGELGIQLALYRRENKYEGIELTQDNDGNSVAVIPAFLEDQRSPYYSEVIYNGGFEEYTDQTSTLVVQIVSGLGQRQGDLDETLMLDVNKHSFIVSADFVQPILQIIESSVDQTPLPEFPLISTYVDTIRSEDALVSTELQQIRARDENSNCIRYCPYADHSRVLYEKDVSLDIHIGLSYSTLFRERDFDCKIDLTDYSIIGEPHECRDALTQLSEWLGI